MSKRSGSTIPGKNPLTPVWISAKTTSLHHCRGNVFLPHFRYQMFFIIYIFCASPTKREYGSVESKSDSHMIKTLQTELLDR